MIEGHSSLGGYTCCFHLDGFRFEVSTHLITGFERGDGIVGDILHHVNIEGQIEFLELNELMRWMDPARNIDCVIPLSLSDHIQQLTSLFPEQEVGIKTFYRLYYPIVQLVTNLQHKKGLDEQH